MEKEELWQRITQWSTDLPPGCQFIEQEYAGIVHRLYSCIVDAYRSLLPRLQSQTDKPLYRKLERGYSSLILWSHSYGVDGGKVDAALEKSNDLRNVIVGILVNICTIFLERLPPRVPGCDDDEWKSSAQRVDAVMSQGRHLLSSEPEEQKDEPIRIVSRKPKIDSLDRIASNLRTMVQTLADLGPLLEDAMIPDEHHDEPAATVDSSATAPNFVSLILHIFPKCNKATANGISKALLQTVQHQENQINMTNETTAERQAQKAETLVESIVDSALGTSVAPTMSSYAETLKEYLGNSDSPVSIKLPKLPEGAKEGKPHYGHGSRKAVVCPICEESYHTGPESVTLLANHLAYHLEPIAAEVIIPGVSFTGPEPNNGQAPGTGSNLVAQEVNGMVYYHDASQLPPVNNAIPPPEASCCKICGYRPKGDPRWFAGSMAKHKKQQHSTGPPKIYCCPYPGCTSQFNRLCNLRRHQRERGHFVESQQPVNPGKRLGEKRNISQDGTKPNPLIEAERDEFDFSSMGVVAFIESGEYDELLRKTDISPDISRPLVPSDQVAEPLLQTPDSPLLPNFADWHTVSEANVSFNPWDEYGTAARDPDGWPESETGSMRAHDGDRGDHSQALPGMSLS
ncbi:hypothetical protein ACJ41O_013642 [Fusarium nematophilum]